MVMIRMMLKYIRKFDSGWGKTNVVEEQEWYVIPTPEPDLENRKRSENRV